MSGFIQKFFSFNKELRLDYKISFTKFLKNIYFQFLTSAIFNGDVKDSKTNSNPLTFENVRLWMHHTEDVPADGHIKDFKFMDQGLYPATSVRYTRTEVWGQSQNCE